MLSKRSRLLLWITATGALCLCAGLLLTHESRASVEQRGTDPVSAVRDFLTDGVVDHSGYAACTYLTPGEQRAVSLRTGGEECRNGFARAGLMMGGHRIQTLHQVDRLSARAAISGDHAEVTLSRAGTSIRFRLVKANLADQQEFLAPNTVWRIASYD